MRIAIDRPHRRLAFVATCVSAVILAGCAAPDSATGGTPAAPSSVPTPTPTPTPTPAAGATATPTPGPASTAVPSATPPATAPTAERPDGWETITVDGWATFDVPPGWTSGPHPDHVAESTDRFLADADGARHVRLTNELAQEQQDPGMCDPTAPWFRVLDTTPLQHAYPGESLVHSTTIQQISIYDYGAQQAADWYEVVSSIYEPERVTDDCVPSFVVYPDAGGYFGVQVHADPQEALHFATPEEAEAYTQTAEYATIAQVIQSFRAVP